MVVLMNVATRYVGLLLFFTAAGCQRSHGETERPTVKPRIPFMGLAFGGRVHDDFLTFLAEKHTCDGRGGMDTCLRGYDVIVEDRGDNYYFLVVSRDKSIKGGGMSYLVDAKTGEVVQRAIQK
jgi:hypothetical protein